MAIFLQKFQQRTRLPAMSDEYIVLVQLFGKFTETEIPSHMSPNITPDGWVGRIVLKTYPSPAKSKEETVADVCIYQSEVKSDSGGNPEQREHAALKEILIDTKHVNEEHPIVPIASRYKDHEGVTLEALVIYRPSFT